MNGYDRQPIEFGPPGDFGGIVRSTRRVSFGPIASLIQNVRHVGIYDPEGNIAAYGLLANAPGSRKGIEEVALEPGAVAVKI